MKTRRFYLSTPKRIHRWFLYFLSVAFAVLATTHLFTGEMDMLKAITIVVFYINAIVLPMQTINRIVIDDNLILIKPDFFSSAKSYAWDKIEKIGLGSYLIEFQIEGKKKSVRLNTANPGTSIAVKQALREFAEEKNKLTEELTH